ncbi:hypothetical protein SRB5_62640 [Streptomyces sp. RB5]|uniref:Uncharacterized protein n=1 Tax=Streptomyces smaragdinus TaxID=2585196 RepID=A0A7K0CST0_9ACTN|nr:hypothetical protein [Streptomyces smaragdinus]MQY16072.1 hypothetical protein [Streptomyces smaragdinus]
MNDALETANHHREAITQKCLPGAQRLIGQYQTGLVHQYKAAARLQHALGRVDEQIGSAKMKPDPERDARVQAHLEAQAPISIRALMADDHQLTLNRWYAMAAAEKFPSARSEIRRYLDALEAIVPLLQPDRSDTV